MRGIVLPVQMGGLLGGAKGYVGPPSQIIGGGGLAPPGPPSSYAYDMWFSIYYALLADLMAKRSGTMKRRRSVIRTHGCREYVMT